MNQRPQGKLYTDEEKLFSLFIDLLDSKQFHVPSYSQEVRYIAFKILTFFCQNYPQLCKNNPSKFISIIINATEEEKDPRCLLLTFGLIHFLLSNFSDVILKPFLPEIFDNLSCYFPISFTPPENDPYKITPEDLRRAHNRCLANKNFITDTLGLVFDKLTASQKDTKLECLTTLKNVIEVFHLSLLCCHF